MSSKGDIARRDVALHANFHGSFGKCFVRFGVTMRQQREINTHRLWLFTDDGETSDMGDGLYV